MAVTLLPLPLLPMALPRKQRRFVRQLAECHATANALPLLSATCPLYMWAVVAVTVQHGRRSERHERRSARCSGRSKQVPTRGCQRTSTGIKLIPDVTISISRVQGCANGRLTEAGDFGT